MVSDMCNKVTSVNLKTSFKKLSKGPFWYHFSSSFYRKITRIFIVRKGKGYSKIGKHKGDEIVIIYLATLLYLYLRVFAWWRIVICLFQSETIFLILVELKSFIYKVLILHYSKHRFIVLFVVILNWFHYLYQTAAFHVMDSEGGFKI